MDNQNTIPSQLGPVTTIPALLTPSSGPAAARSGARAAPGLWFTLVLLVLAVVLVVVAVG